MARSLGIVECNCYSEVLAAADRMDKAADIRPVRQEQIGDGRVALVVEGETDEVSRSLEAAKNGAPEALTATLVPNTSTKVLSLFDLPGGRFWRR